jgi:hypothetical protein
MLDFMLMFMFVHFFWLVLMFMLFFHFTYFHAILDSQ